MGTDMTTDSEIQTKTPSEQLAERILTTLTNKKFILPDDAKNIADKLATGKLQAEDWRMVIEKAIYASEEK